MKLIKLTLILALLSLASCADQYSDDELERLLETGSYTAMASKGPARVAAWENYSTHERYTSYVEEGLKTYGKSLLSDSFRVDDAGFCPRYNKLSYGQRMKFWVMMVSSIVEHESKFNTNAKYLEKNGQYSRGLLQLGFQSTKGYRCGFKNQYEINKSPRKSLHCGVKILNHWIRKDKAIRNPTSRTWRGAARYWSVLRFEIWPIKKRNRLLGIKRNTNALRFCKK